MTSLPTAYTPLESLLLFQALRFESPSSHSVFNRISEQLKSVRLVTSDPQYDPGRLSPDALRETYLWLLKEEAKRDLDDQFDDDSILQNGDASPGSRKRKAPSSSLPSVHEAAQHEHLIPQLVTRLYRSYREHVVKEIREHERRYDASKREIEEIEAGKWDERLQRQRTASATQSPRPSSSAHMQPLLDKKELIRASNSTTASPKSPQKTLDNSTQTSKPYAQNKIDSLINHGPEPQNASNNHRRTSSTTTLPPLSEMAPRSPHFGIPPTIPAPGYNQSPTTAHQSPYATQHGHPGPLGSPQVQNSLSRPSSSDRPILPPPPGMKLPPPSPGPHTGSPGIRGPPLPPQQQYQAPQPPPHRLSSGLSPTNDRNPPAYPTSQVPAAPSGYYQQQQPYLDRRTSYPPPQQYPAAPVYPNPGQHPGYQLAPFTVEQQQAMANGPQNQANMQQYQQQALSQQSPGYAQWNQMRGQQSQSVPSTAPRPVRPPNNRVVSDIIAALATPPRMKRRPLWRIETDPRLMAGGGTPLPRPEVEPLSPVLKRSEPASRPTRSTRGRDTGTAEQSEDPDSILKSSRRRAKRDRSPHSVVSSIADESARMTRSQSVSTPLASALPSDDRPASRGRVKAEPSTPAGFTDDGDAAHELPSGGAMMTRKRRGTLQSQPQPPPKRKRQHSPNGADLGDSEDRGTPPPKPTTVLASRNFHKTSATIMNDINSHKHASYFTSAVRDKDAPGYSEIIKQPQNLKGIRTAIAAGTRAVNAATSVLDSPSAAGTPTGSMTKSVGDSSTTVELDRTIDLIPPKAIVNGAQLEKEVMRIFANAVMFNPGEDGMVSITREMFEDVDAKIQEWRGAEKEAGETEMEDDGKAKRRKLL